MALLPSLNGPDDLKRLPLEQLPELAAEIRAEIINQVSRSGGHLAPNLGVVELSIALHYVFDFAHDRLLFDVGHQCYPHKLLTGRFPMLANLRTRRGMAGFPDPRESAYDQFSVGHAGTGISTAVGMARGDDMNGEGFDPHQNADGRRVVALIGDASIVNGVAMEGLNNAGTLRRQFLVVLNDNGMSISKPQGGVAHYFDRLRINPIFGDVKHRAREVLDSLPGGSLVKEAYHRMGDMAKAAVAENTWFEHFGLLTVGPIDGHDLPELVQYLAEAKAFDRPMVLHVKTTKGKGFDAAEGDATTFHSPAAFTFHSESCRVEMKRKGRAFTTAFADAMGDAMEADEKIIACTAAMPSGTGLDKVAERFPDRVFDTGICESHATDMMAGMAKTGLKPFFAVYSTFLQRTFDQVFQEASLQGLPVRLCLDRAGLVGGDGAVHHGFCDISILRTLPDAVLIAAMDEPSLRAAIAFMADHDDGVSAVRYPRDNVADTFAGEPCPPFEIGRARALIEHEQPDVAVLALGTCVIEAHQALDLLGPEHRVNLYDARFAKPVDRELISDLLTRGVPILTIEDHGPHGGFGAAVVEAASDLGLTIGSVRRLALPDGWIHQNSRAEQLAEAGIDAISIARAIREIGERQPSGAPVVEVRASKPAPAATPTETS